MSARITSIVGVICLGILLEIVLPQGKSAKYVKGAFSLLIIFVIAAPLPKLLKSDWKLDFDGSAFKVDDAFVEETKDLYADGVRKDIEDYLTLCGYESDVKIVLEEGTVSKVKRVDVSVRAEIVDEKEASELTEQIKDLLCARLRIGREKLFVTVDRVPPNNGNER